MIVKNNWNYRWIKFIPVQCFQIGNKIKYTSYLVTNKSRNHYSLFQLFYFLCILLNSVISYRKREEKILSRKIFGIFPKAKNLKKEMITEEELNSRLCNVAFSSFDLLIRKSVAFLVRYGRNGERFRECSHWCSRLCTVLGSLPYGRNIVPERLVLRFLLQTIILRCTQRGFHNNRKKGDPRYSGPKRLFLTII